MIRISYHAGGMKDQPLEKVMEILSGAGYDGIEMMCGPEAHIPSGEVTDSLLREVRSMVTEAGLVVPVINPFTAPNLMAMADENRDEAIRFYSLLQDVAVELGATGVNFLSGWSGKGDPHAWKVLVDVLKPLSARAGELGLTMNIHNHESNIIDAPDKVPLLIHHVGSPHLKLLMDITNFYHLGSEVGETARRLAHLTVHCHVKGVKGLYPFSQFLIPGEPEDELDFQSFARGLGGAGYDRHISVETFPHMRMEKAQIAYDMMDSILGELGLRRSASG